MEDGHNGRRIGAIVPDLLYYIKDAEEAQGRLRVLDAYSAVYGPSLAGHVGAGGRG